MSLTDRRTDRRIERAEFTEPSNTFANPKIDAFPIKKILPQMNKFPHTPHFQQKKAVESITTSIVHHNMPSI